MENNKLLFIYEDGWDIERIKKTFKDSCFEIVGACADGKEGIDLIDKLQPNFVVTGLVLSSIDGFEVLKHLSAIRRSVKAVVVSALKNERIIKNAMDLGALYYMTMPISSSVLLERLKGLCEKDKKDSFELKAVVPPALSLDERISKIFISVGIPPHIKGYAYLREGVKMAVDNPKIINSITKKLYPMIGDKYETSASKVERAIRHAIEVAWNRNRIDSINSVFGVRAYVGSEKPTNGEFIALVADKMLLEGA